MSVCQSPAGIMLSATTFKAATCVNATQASLGETVKATLMTAFQVSVEQNRQVVFP